MLCVVLSCTMAGWAPIIPCFKGCECGRGSDSARRVYTHRQSNAATRINMKHISFPGTSWTCLHGASWVFSTQDSRIFPHGPFASSPCNKVLKVQSGIFESDHWHDICGSSSHIQEHIRSEGRCRSSQSFSLNGKRWKKQTKWTRNIQPIRISLSIMPAFHEMLTSCWAFRSVIKIFLTWESQKWTSRMQEVRTTAGESR